MVLQQIRNTIAVRVIRPRGVDKTELEWVHLGFEGDDEAMTERRLRQGNLIGAAGYISMEDGCVGGFVQRALQYNDDGSGRRDDGRPRGAVADIPRQRGGDPRLLEEIPRADRRLRRRGRAMDDTGMRQGVHELIAAYVDCIDDDRLEEWPDFFVDQCRYLITSRESHIAGYRHAVVYATSKGMLKDRVPGVAPRQHLRAAPLPPHRRPDPNRPGRGRRGAGPLELYCRAHHA